MNNRFARATGIPGPGNEALVFLGNDKELQNMQAGIPYVGLNMMQPAFFKPNLQAMVMAQGGYPVGNALDNMAVQPLMLNPNAVLPPFLGG